MKIFNTLAITVLLTVTTFAQVQNAPAPKAATPEIKLPEVVEIDAPTFKILKEQEQKLRLTTLEAENLSLRIANAENQLKEARTNLKKLQEKAQMDQTTMQDDFAKAAKLPADKLGEYVPEEKDGKLILRRKQPAK